MPVARSRFAAQLAGCLLLAGCQQAVRPVAPQADAALPEIAAAQATSVASPDPQAPAPVAVTEPTIDPAIVIPTATASAKPAPMMGRGGDVFARISKGLSPNSCSAGDNSVRWRKRYAGNSAAFARHLEEALPLLDFVSLEVERSGLPSEFVFIPLVESWYRPDAMGPGGPAGMWQMIASTARNHGVHINPGYDGRLSPVESTRAALSYLKTLQQIFGDWQTIVMAYNAGEGRIQNAFKRSRSREASAALRRPHGLSNITYDYVAKLQALSCLISEPQRNGLALPQSTRFVPVLAVLADEKVDSLEEFARRQDQDPKQLRRLNPGFRNGRIVSGVPRLVLTPTVGWQAPVQDDRSLLASNSDRHPGMPDEIPSAAATEPQVVIVHEVRDGDSLWSIARRYGMSLDALRRINQLGTRAVVHPGQKLKLSP